MTPTERPTRTDQLQALVLALACSVLFLRDALLPGRALVPHPPELFDVHMAEAIARGAFDQDAVFRGNVGMGDKYWQSLCWDRVLRDGLRSGAIPAWTRDIGGGAPFAPQMAQPYEPINALLLLLPAEQWYGWAWLVQQALFAWLAYLFLRRLGCAHGAALVGLVAASLGLWTQCRLHHNVVLTAALPLWPMLSCVHELVTRARGQRTAAVVAALGAWTALSWLSGFVVVSVLATYLAAGFASWLAWMQPRGERRRGLLLVAGGLALGGALSLANTAPILFAWLDSARRAGMGVEQVTAHGLEAAHLLSSWWPDLFSWPADQIHGAPAGRPPDEWFTRVPWSQLVLLSRPVSALDGVTFHGYVETAFSIGAVASACAVAALGDRARWRAWLFFAGAGAIAFGFATGQRPFADLVPLVPGLSAGDLRRCVFPVAMAGVVLAALGADALLRGNGRWPLRTVLAIAAAVSAAALAWLLAHRDDDAFVLALAGWYGGDPTATAAAVKAAAPPGEIAHNHAMLTGTAVRALVVSVLALGATLLPPRRSVLALAGLAAIELLHAGLGPVVTVPSARVTTPPAVLAPVLAAAESNGVRPRLQRVAGGARLEAALPGNFPGFLGIEDGSSYQALAAARLGDFFRAIEPDREGKPSVVYRTAGVGAFRDVASLRHPLSDLFGIRFVLTREDVPANDTLIDRTPPLTGGFRLLERTTVLPRATFVHEVDLLPDLSRRLAELARIDRDVRHRVVLEDAAAPPAEPAPERAATVTIVSHADERVVVRVDTDAAGYLRLADPFDPGWRATIGDAPAKVLVADHLLRAVHVPRGVHEVVFTYDGPRVVWPRTLSALALLVTLALVLLRRRVR